MKFAKKEWKEIFKLSGIAAFIAGLCCFTPLLLVLVGLGLGLIGVSFAPGDVGFASELANFFYGQHKWLFRSFGLVALAGALVVYFRNKGICTIDEVKKNRTKVINITLLVVGSAIVLYILWLYVVVHYAGVWLNIWSNY